MHKKNVELENTKNGRDDKKVVSITSVSRAFDITTRTLRHWEDIGLLLPKRNSHANFQMRYYDAHDVARISAIIALSQSGIELNDIKQLVQYSKISDDKLLEFEDKLSSLSQASNIISAFIPQYSNNYSIEEYTLYQQYTVVKSKWVANVNEAYKFYLDALIECLNEGYEITSNYSLFCQYPLNTRKDNGELYFVRENFLMRFYMPVKANFTGNMPKDRFINNDIFKVRPIENFVGIQTDFVLMPPCHAISTVHFGTSIETDQAYEKLYDYMDKSGYQIYSSIHEIYLNKPKTNAENDKLITRIVLPVLPIGAKM